MPSPLSTFRGYFRVKSREKPTENQLNALLIDKIDIDVNSLFGTAGGNQAAIATLKARVDLHADQAGILTATAPEFGTFAPTPTFVSTSQFTVVGNFTNELTANRALKAILTGSQPVSQIVASAFDSGTGKTTVTLFDAILTNTLTAVQLGAMKDSLPRIAIGNLNFDPATQAELDSHKALNDHVAIGARVKRSATQAIPNNTLTPILWDIEVFDSLNFHSTVTNTERLTIPLTGKYVINLSVMWNNNSVGTRFISITDGTDFLAVDRRAAFFFSEATLNTGLVPLSAGAFVQAVVLQDIGSALAIGGSDLNRLSFSIEYRGQ